MSIILRCSITSVLICAFGSASLARAEEPLKISVDWSKDGGGASKEKPKVDEDGTVYLPPLAVPLSNLLSPQARAGTAKYLNFMATPASKLLGVSGDPRTIVEERRTFDAYFAPILTRIKAVYPTQSIAATIGGVYVDVITPQDGIAPQNKDRVLLNLHGGAYVAGARTIGALESVPVASLGKIKVLAVDYRQGPEYKFPAASDDVAAVYKELLKTYRPQNIGIYGCSAGGFLTAQATAMIQKKSLPKPGAIGIFCASAGGYGDGDSSYLGAALMGYQIQDPSKFKHPAVVDAVYFSDADFNDPLVAPVRSPLVLAKFPPTLVLTSSRDSAASAAMYTHTQLIKAGVEADLHIWEGLPHAFFTMEPDFPESREAWDVVVKFFAKHLGAQ